jgi:hypothetical protein
MKRDDAFELAAQWRGNPELLVGDLRAACDWLIQNSAEPTDVVARSTGARIMDAALVPESLERLIPLHKALAKYVLLLKMSKLDPGLLEPVLESLTIAKPESTDVVSAPVGQVVTLTGIATAMQSIESVQRWVNRQLRLKSEEGNRSEILKTTIELADDELLVKTDQDGSLKLRGSTNIPMFLAFFRTPKHHLSVDAFLDIDRTVKATNLDRHRVRLSSKLHDVFIEIVEEKDGYRMRKYR